MQIILLTKAKKKTLYFSGSHLKALASIMGSFVLLLLLVVVGYYYLPKAVETDLVQQQEELINDLLAQRAELERMRERTTNTLDSMALRVGSMQAQLTRLNAVGEHLVKKAKIDSPEFNFDELPALGSAGLDTQTESFTESQLLHDIDVLDDQLSRREKQLSLLDVFSANKKLSKEVRPAGLPVAKGWLSSRYGYRADPFTGKRKFHHGVDIAGKSGTNVLAAASGLVTWVGKKGGYGYLIELDHGSGYVTRYAHNKETVVKQGDMVKQNDVIAKMGSTGHSTGPHLHFEVLKHGKTVNPRQYLYAAR